MDQGNTFTLRGMTAEEQKSIEERRAEQVRVRGVVWRAVHVSRLVGRRLELMREDQFRGQVEEHVITNWRRGIGNIEALSMKRACVEFVESMEGRKIPMNSALRVLGQLGTLRVVVLPLSRIVLKIDNQ